MIHRRLAINPDHHRFLSDPEWRTLRALCNRIVPQPSDREHPVPLAAMIDAKLDRNERDGYRDARLPTLREAWRRGLAAIEEELRARHGRDFHTLAPADQDELLVAIQHGRTEHAAWGTMSPHVFFAKRVLHDIVSAYYAHPSRGTRSGSVARQPSGLCTAQLRPPRSLGGFGGTTGTRSHRAPGERPCRMIRGSCPARLMDARPTSSPGRLGADAAVP